jgi:hypothetical protein
MALRSGILALGLLWLSVLRTTVALSVGSTTVEGMHFLELENNEPSGCTAQNMRVRKEW